MPLPPRRAPGWTARLLRWYDRHRRWMPWRAAPSPYRVWVSEIMLQQTQVATVIPYFERFMACFPDPAALAAAPLQDLLKAWEGLGYYSRARHLHRAAQALAAAGGRLPERAEELARLPGIGPYTAAAIASICFGEPVPVVDGNVLRVFARFWGLEDDIRAPRVRRALAGRLAPCMPPRRAGDFNQAIMELGATVCRPRQPRCDVCPLLRDCAARREGRVAELPRTGARKAVPHVTAAAAVLSRGGRLLVVRRPTGGMLGGLWECPAAALRPGETPEDACRRGLRETAGLAAGVLRPLGTVAHAYSHFTLTLHAFAGSARRGRMAAGHGGGRLRWCRPAELGALPFHVAARRVLALASAEAGSRSRAHPPA